MQNEKVTRSQSNNDRSTAHPVYSPSPRLYHTPSSNSSPGDSYDHPDLHTGHFTAVDALPPGSLQIEGDSLDEADSAQLVSSSTNSWTHMEDIEQDTDSLMDCSLDSSASPSSQQPHPHPTPPSPSAAKRPRLETSEPQPPLYNSSNNRRIRVASPMSSSAPPLTSFSDTPKSLRKSTETKPPSHPPNILPATAQTPHRNNVTPENIQTIPFYPFPTPQTAVAGSATPTSPRKGKGSGKKRGNYRCRKCGQAKKGHTCRLEVQSSPSPPIVPSSPGPSNTPSPDQALHALRERIREQNQTVENLTRENKSLKEEREELQKQLFALHAQKSTVTRTTTTTHHHNNNLQSTSSNIDGDINSFLLNALASGSSSGTSGSVLEALPPNSMVPAPGNVNSKQ